MWGPCRKARLCTPSFYCGGAAQFHSGSLYNGNTHVILNRFHNHMGNEWLEREPPSGDSDLSSGPLPARKYTSQSSCWSHTAHEVYLLSYWSTSLVKTCHTCHKSWAQLRPCSGVCNIKDLFLNGPTTGNSPW